LVGGPWLGIADLSFSMLVMMNSGSDDSIVKLSIAPQLSMLAVILLSGILPPPQPCSSLYGRVGGKQDLKNFHVQNSI
jgi:hypothetical protein